MNNYYLSQKRLDELKAELNEFKTVKRIEVSERLKRAKEYGDLSENAEYEHAREEQGDVESRIEELEDIIRNATIIQKSASRDFVDLGAEVEIKVNAKTKKFTIVGSTEAKPEAGLISSDSPLGKALIGKKVGDTVVIKAPVGDISYQITNID